MKKLLALGLLVVGASTFTLAQTKSSRGRRSPSAEQEIRRLEREWFDSYVRGDRAAFDRIVADDAVFTYGNGSVGNKSEAIGEIKAPADPSYSLTADDIKVRVYGNTAIVTGIVIEKGTFNGRSINSRSRYTDVWVRRSGRWQVVSAQNTRLPQPHPSVPASVSDAYLGKYELAPNLIITISRDGDRLMSEVGGRKSELVPESEAQFAIPSANIRIRFVKDANGQVSHLLVNDNGREGQAKRIQ